MICNNCIGALILKDLGLRYNSPFVNLWIKSEDYYKLCKNFKEYMNYDIVQVQDSSVNYPVGKLNDILIYFMQYDNFENAKLKWDERKKE